MGCVWSDSYGQLRRTVQKSITFSREDQDKFAIDSYRKSQQAQLDGYFESEIIPVSIKDRKGNEQIIDKDEEPYKGEI